MVWALLVGMAREKVPQALAKVTWTESKVSFSSLLTWMVTGLLMVVPATGLVMVRALTAEARKAKAVTVEKICICCWMDERPSSRRHGGFYRSNGWYGNCHGYGVCRVLKIELALGNELKELKIVEEIRIKI